MPTQSDQQHPLTICIALYSFNMGGSERLALQLAKHYLTHGYRIVCCATRRGVGPLMQEFEDIDIPCLALDLESLSHIGKLFAKRRLKNWLADQHVACVHAQHFSVYSDIYNACTAANVHCHIVTEHTADYLINNKQYGAVTRKLAPKASVIVAINEVVSRAIIHTSGIRANRISVIENGIDTTRFCPIAKLRSDLCEVVWLGRLHPDKDILNGLRAFHEAIQSNSSLTLNVVGDGEEGARAKDYVREYGLESKVSFSGELADPCKALQQADLFLLSSVTEGTPLAMLEALSCGLPVVSTAVGGIPCIISNDVGTLAPPRDPRALSRGILQLVENPNLRVQMGRNARQLAERRFSESNMATAYIKLIEQHTK